MEPLSNLIQTAATLNKSNENPKPLSRRNSVSPEQNVALWKLINRARMLNGWQTRSAADLDDTIETWGEMFNHYEIPLAAYPELYERAFDTRQRKMQQGGDVPQMDATLIVAHWTGEHGLKAEYNRREIERGRTLGANAASVCQHCFGTGWRPADASDRSAGVKRCNHQD